MKKVILSAALVAAGLLTASAQGTIKFYNISSLYAVTVNGAPIPTAAAAPNAYYFTVLVDTSTPTSGNPLTGGWTDATTSTTPLIGHNTIVAGGISGNGGSSGVAIDGIPVGGGAYFEVVGWSASLGTTWSDIATQLEDGWSTAGYYGMSSYADVATGGVGTPPSNAAAIFSPTLISSGFALAPVVPTPEPTSIALGVMGGLSLLALRRKKA
jgi:uncharacterized protein YcfJ